MKNFLKVILALVVIGVIGAGVFYYLLGNDSQGGRVFPGFGDTLGGKLKADTFTGTLEEVNTGCFADGECYVVVSGKHVTILTGMRIDPPPVGQILGAPSIGDLESKIGSKVEVYAQDKGDGTFTLYGSSGFYLKVLD